jgi:hypothetical protein
MTQEIKIILTLKRKNMIPNIKSSEGIGDGVLKKVIHAGSESIMFSVLQETQYVYPFKSSVREIVSNCLDSVTEKQLQKNYKRRAAGLRSVHYKRRNRVFWVRL